MSYASILRDLKRCVNPDELGVTIQVIRETRSKDLLVELKCPKDGRRQPNSAFPKEVKEAVIEFCQQGPEMGIRVSLTKKTLQRDH